MSLEGGRPECSVGSADNRLMKGWMVGWMVGWMSERVGFGWFWFKIRKIKTQNKTWGCVSSTLLRHLSHPPQSSSSLPAGGGDIFACCPAVSFLPPPFRPVAHRPTCLACRQHTGSHGCVGSSFLCQWMSRWSTVSQPLSSSTVSLVSLPPRPATPAQSGVGINTRWCPVPKKNFYQIRPVVVIRSAHAKPGIGFCQTNQTKNGTAQWKKTQKRLGHVVLPPQFSFFAFTTPSRPRKFSRPLACEIAYGLPRSPWQFLARRGFCEGNIPVLLVYQILFLFPFLVFGFFSVHTPLGVKREILSDPRF